MFLWEGYYLLIGTYITVRGFYMLQAVAARWAGRPVGPATV